MSSQQLRMAVVASAAFAVLGGIGCVTPGQQVPSSPQLPSQRLERERGELERRMQQGGSSEPTLRRELGWALLIEGHWERAEKVLTEAIAADPKDVRALFGLALCAQETAQHRKLQDLWLRILEAASEKHSEKPGDGRGDPWAPAIAEVAAHRLLVSGPDGTGAEPERRLRERLQAVLQRGTLPLEAHELLSALLGQLLRLIGEENAARRVDVERGCPPSFYVSGPVGNLPALDLLTSFPADNPAHDPQRAGYLRRSGYGCNVALDTAGGRSGVMFATTWARFTKTGPQPLTIESGGAPWALYVDGRLSHLDQDPRRRQYLWLYLQPGWHSLVLKVGTSGRVQVQLSAPGLTFFDGSVEQPPHTVDAGTVTARRRWLTELPDAKSGREQVLRALLRGQQAHVSGDAEAGLDAIEGVASSVPRFAAFSLLRAALLLEDRTRPERLMRDQTRSLLEQVLKEEPRLLRARLSLATLMLQEEHPDQAQELLESAPKPAEPNWQVPLLYYRVLKARGWLVEAEKALAEAAILGPSACALLEAQVDLRREYQDVRGALEASAKLSACNRYSDRLADELVDAGRMGEAEREYLRLLALEPENEEWRGSLARLLTARRGQGDLEQARLLRAGLLAQAPRSVNHRIELANLLVAMGKREDARAVIHDGTRLLPESAEFQRALLALGERGLMDSYRIDGRQVITDFLAKNPGTFDGEPAVMLLDRTVVRVLSTGARLTLTHNIIRVLTKDGLAKFGEVRIPDGAEVLTLRTIKADGSTREPEEIPEKDSISAPDLEVGDYVEFEYLDREPPLPAFPRGFLAERFYFASADAPLDRSEYVLVVPTDMPLQVDARGPVKNGQRDIPQADVRTEGELRTYTWQRRQAARMRPEPPLSEAVIDDWLPSVRVASGLSFASYSNYLRDRRIRTLYLGREVRALAIQIAGPDPAKSSRGDVDPITAPGGMGRLITRARQLDEWVRRNIQDGGSIEEAATSILSRRQGRRDVLLMALLRAAGIPCEMWLVRPQTAPQLDGQLPDLTAYHEVIIAVAPGRGPAGQPALFLDPSFRHVASGYVRPMLRGARALRLPEPTAAPPLPQASFVDVPLPSEGGATAAFRSSMPHGLEIALRDSRRLEMDMTLLPDGAGEVSVRETLTGGPAVEWREHVENLSQEKLRQELEQRALGFYFPGASLGELKYGPMDRDDEPLVVEYRFKAPHLARQRGESGTSELVLPAPYPVLLSRNYVHVSNRQTPLLVHYVVPTTLDANIHLPAGARLVQTTPTLELTEFGRFSQRVTPAAGAPDRLQLHTELSLPLVRIAPERYGQFVNFARRIDGVEETIAVFAARP